MKRGNTALKRVVSVASVAAMAVAGAVLAAPAASAAIGGTLDVRPTPSADAANLVDPFNLAAEYGTEAFVTVPVVGVGNGRAVQDAQITIGGDATGGALAAGDLFDDGDTLDVTLTGPDGVSFTSKPIATISGAVDLSSLSKLAGWSGDKAHAAPALPAGDVTGTAPKVSVTGLSKTTVDNDTATVLITNDAQGIASKVTYGNVGYIVSLSGVRVSVASDAEAGPIVATVGGASAVLGYVAPFTIAFAGDANGYPANVKGATTLPDIVVTETSENAFVDGFTYSLAFSGTDLDKTGGKIFSSTAPTKVTPSSKVKVTGSADFGEEGTDGTIVDGADETDALQSLTFSGATISDYKAGSDVKVSLVVEDGGPSNIFVDGAGITAEADSVLSLTVPQITQVPRDLSGNSRYATAKNIASKLGVGNAIVLANGTSVKNGFDALAANYLAGAKDDAPIVLTDSSDNLPQATQDAIAARFKAQAGDLTIYVLGKTDSVSAAAEARAKFVATTAAAAGAKVTVVRLDGDNRYETAALAVKTGGSTALQSYNLGHGALYTAFLASGTVNADALAAGALAAGAGIPVLLTDGKTLNDDIATQIKDLNIQQLIVLGGTDRVSQDAIDAAVEAGVNKDAVIRIAGEGTFGRYDTAAALNELAIKPVADKGLGIPVAGTAYLANGADGFPDALTIGPLAGKNTNPLLTVPTNTLPDSTKAFLTDHKSVLTGVQALGQSDRIADDVISAAQKAIL